MAQTGKTPISLYYSTTGGNTPTAGNLVDGELAINTADGKLFYKDSSGVVQTIASKTAASTSFSAGTTGLTPNIATTGAVTLAGTLNVANGGTGTTTSTGSGSVVLSSSPTITSPTISTGYTAPNATGSTTFGFKNRIINGAMVIDQRNAGASVGTGSTSYFSIYSLDRWSLSCSVINKFTAQQSSTAPIGFTNSLLATSSSAYSIGAGDYFTIGQRIEGYNVADLGWGTANAKTVTLSFQVYSSLTGTFGGALSNGSRSYPFTYTVSSANTWTTASVTVVGDTSGTWDKTNGNGLQLTFGLGVGSTYSGTAGSWAGSLLMSATGAVSVVGTSGATFYITGVQLEVGTQATSFDYRPYGTELALCQRYCYVTGGSAYSNFYSGFFNTTTDFQGPVVMPVTMRSAPTLTTSGNFQVISNSSYSATSLTLGASETTSMTAKINGTVSGATAGYGGTMRANNDTTAKLILSAEL